MTNDLDKWGYISLFYIKNNKIIVSLFQNDGILLYFKEKTIKYY